MPQTNRPRPIRYDQDTWLVMRTDPVIPKAVIFRVHQDGGDRYLVIKWDIDPQKRELMRVVDSLERADALVVYDKPDPGTSHPYTEQSRYVPTLDR